MNRIKSLIQNKWAILILGCLTNAIAVAVQGMSLSVLLPEISNTLDLNLVQAGLVWGIASLPSMVSFIIAGKIIDRFGPKIVITTACILVGVFGALRGAAVNFGFLLAFMLLFGFFSAFIPLSNVKNIGLWFDDHELGLANGVLSLGMAIGFFVGSMVSASYVSPWIGGWRYTFLFYGIIAFLFAIPWLFTKSPEKDVSQAGSIKQTLWQDVKHLSKIRNLWLLGMVLMAFSGAVQGFLGYIPLYFRSLGLADIRADSMAASFHLASMLFVIPLALLSDKIRSRKTLVMGAVVLTSLGIGSVLVLRGDALWGAVIAAGLTRDGVMAILITMILETKGIGKAYAGIATGFTMFFAGIGSLISPPIGNKLASITPSTPFLFWAALCAAGLICLGLIDDSTMLRQKMMD